ncbi:hypothetical protein K4R60_06235 [Staphylococcus epidermidis]|uniref:hypothetical protein n=1 Tax=Staphylococcus epidermidis TaxID=1282 RepID=UPI00189B118C|nr:hypothetical protein [Staphylococcus epidermidis]MCG1613922.1 hypothetical protein [Staphylococcus epidermidis]
MTRRFPIITSIFTILIVCMFFLIYYGYYLIFFMTFIVSSSSIHFFKSRIVVEINYPKIHFKTSNIKCKFLRNISEFIIVITFVFITFTYSILIPFSLIALINDKVDNPIWSYLILYGIGLLGNTLIIKLGEEIVSFSKEYVDKIKLIAHCIFFGILTGVSYLQLNEKENPSLTEQFSVILNIFLGTYIAIFTYIQRKK